MKIGEIRDIIERAFWNVHDLGRHRPEELLRTNVPAKMREQIDALDTLEIAPRFTEDIEHREYVRGACERQIERWMAAQRCSSVRN